MSGVIKKEVSLLPDSENSASIISRTIRWLTTVGRVVIIFTELIVVSAFLSRFWLDRKNSDLSEVVRQQKAILKSTQDFEKELALVQKKIAYIKNSYQRPVDYKNKLISLVESTPPEITYESVKLTYDAEKSETLSSVTIIAKSEEAIISFVTNLALNPNIKYVDVGSITKKPREVNYVVGIQIVFANSKT